MFQVGISRFARNIHPGRSLDTNRFETTIMVTSSWHKSISCDRLSKNDMQNNKTPVQPFCTVGFSSLYLNPTGFYTLEFHKHKTLFYINQKQ